MKLYQALILIILGGAAILAGAIGWWSNLLTLFEREVLVLSGETVLRIVGVFVVPLGAVMGWV